MTWESVVDNRGLIRAVRMSDRNRRIVRWDGLEGPTTEWGQANARMMIAAPEMLGALEDVIDSWKYGESITKAKEQYEAAIATIAKARGEKRASHTLKTSVKA